MSFSENALMHDVAQKEVERERQWSVPSESLSFTQMFDTSVSVSNDGVGIVCPTLQTVTAKKKM